MSFDVVLQLSDEQVEQIARRAAELVAGRAPITDEWLTVAEAANYLRCPKSRVYSLVSAKRIPFVKDGSRTLFSRGALDEWLRAGGGRRP